MASVFRPEPKSPWGMVVDIAGVVPKAIRLLWDASPVLTSFTVLIMMFQSLVPATVLFMIAQVVDGVIEAVATGQSWGDLVWPSSLVIFLWVLDSALGSWTYYARDILTERAYTIASTRLLNRAMTLDLAFFEAPRFYDRLHHATRQLWSINSICWSLLGVVSQVVRLSSMFALLTVLHWGSILVLFATTVPRIYFEGYFARKRFDLELDMVRNTRMANYLQSTGTGRQQAKEVRAFRLQDYLVNRFRQFRGKWLNAYRAYLSMEFKAQIGLGALSMGGVAAIWFYGVIEAVAGVITIGSLSMVLGAAQQAQGQLGSLISSAGGMYQQTMFITLYYDLLEMSPQDIEGALRPPTSSDAPNLPVPLEHGIEFQNVTFRYPGTDKDVLKDLSLRIPSGKKVALVGENGSGKTTVIKLLMRFYDPNSGTVYFDGLDAVGYDLDSIRDNISVVFQDFVRYDFTAGENIGLGDVNSIDDSDRIQVAAQRGGAAEVIDGLANGIDTVLGRTLDEGVDLSGGEWQQLGISRGFMKDVQCMILDEPTAAIDALREHALYERFAELTQGKTVVFISHRFSTVRMADHIIVLEDGQAIEEGSHGELMARGGKYAKMFTVQAEKYQL